ncbi:ATP-binding protein [Candidatus Igneacidithiobacillus taiwanensis]|uniref:AAA family ATPase n=1 Tax=Candidatus Igneacidithiobacillus taiwanensis TaxID=1945924 RepID=UPI0028A25D74|nr:ATP-binding protein [Candidatus Igneacidithiobacillus taiwanensis]
MLHSYAATNFQSFRDRVEVNLLINERAPRTDWVATSVSGQRVSKVLGVIGANASGKTALLKPLAFLGWFLSASFQQTQPGAPIPVSPHFANAAEPVELECTAEIEGELWRYVLRCTPQRVLHEALYRKHDRFRYVYIRDWDEAKAAYTVRQQDFGLDQSKSVEARPNVSLIAWAAQYGVPLALSLATPIVSSNVNMVGRVQTGDLAVLQAGKSFYENPSLREQMERLLYSWDLGLSGLSIRESEVVQSVTDPDVKQKIWMPYGHHVSHGQDFELPFFLESNGTKSAFSLLSFLLPTLNKGGLAVIDEIESDLHPHMLAAILDLFASQRTNPHNAQLVFTSHAIEVLNLLGKQQVMLVEKSPDCESTAFRLDQISGVRGDVSLYGKYMAGAFGAVPNL